MNISWNLLNTILDLKTITRSQLSEKLILAGFEVENITHLPNIEDTIFTISVTANRQDVLCIMGIAKEISAILNVPLKKTPTRNIKFIKDTLQLTTYSRSKVFDQLIVSVIENIYSSNHPAHITKYLTAYNIDIKNNIVDIINLMNLKWGQNIKIIKLNTYITNIIPKNSSTYLKEEQIDNSCYYKPIICLNGNDIPILDIPSNVNNIEPKDTLLLISNICKSNYDQNKSNKYNNATKLTENVLKSYFLDAHFETLELIHKYYKCTQYKTYFYKDSNSNHVDKKIYINIKKIHEILGPCEKFKAELNESPIYLSNKDIINILKKLQLQPKIENYQIIITIPEARNHDLNREIDIIEEIARIHGYNKFIDKIPQNKYKGLKSYRIININKIRKILRSMGLHEITTYSIVKHKYSQNKSIILYNPSIEDQTELRNTLIENLIRANMYNNNQGNEVVEGFEIGKIFHKDTINEKEINIEKTYLSGILGNSNYLRRDWSDKPSSLSWFQAKGHLEEFFERTNMSISWASKTENSFFFKNLEKYLHPKKTCLIISNHQEIGIFGQLNLKISRELNALHETYIFEMDLEPILKNRIISPIDYSYHTYSSYPSITRDISINVYKHINTKNLINIISEIKENKTNLIESIEIFDEYYTEKDKLVKKIGLRTKYRSKEKTLTNDEIKELEQYVKNRLNSYLLSYNLIE